MTEPELEQAAAAAVSIRAPYERFPATVKGAFVVRGRRPRPAPGLDLVRQVHRGRRAAGRRIELEPVTLDVAPNWTCSCRSNSRSPELAPGWYELECDDQGRRRGCDLPRRAAFLVAWPRGAVRRGRVPIGKRLRSQDGGIEIEHVDLAGDSIKVHVAAAAPEHLSLRLFADGAALPVLGRRRRRQGRERRRVRLPAASDAGDPSHRNRCARRPTGSTSR